MSMSSAKLLGWMLTVMVGCAGAVSAVPTPDRPDTTDEPSTPMEGGEVGSPGPSGVVESAVVEPSAPSPLTRPEPVLMRDSAPPGLHLLTDAEQQQLKNECGKLVQWAQKRVGRAATRAAATQKLLEVLTETPKLDGVDVAACRELLAREARIYVARAKEAEAATILKTLMVAMTSALEANGKLCSDAGPVPRKLDLVKTSPYSPQPGDWDGSGWRCLGVAIQQPQRFQYQVKSDPPAGSFEIVARGYPVEGAEATELFLRCDVVDGKVDMHSDIYRR